MKVHLAAPFAALIAPIALADPITLNVDATRAAQHIFHATLDIPAAPGPLTLAYPKWIPGEHGPTGPIADLANLTISASSKPVAWRRDLSDMHSITLTVPTGEHSIHVELDYLSPPGANATGTTSPSSSAQLADIDWHRLLVYPLGKPTGEQQFVAMLKLPAGWHAAGALEVDSSHGDSIRYKPVSLEMLVDSPLLAGAHLKQIDLTPNSPVATHLDIAADSEKALDIKPAFLASYKSLANELPALFHARHYRHYDLMLLLSEAFPANGIEHHESSENWATEHAVTDDDEFRRQAANLLTHEWFHSWNGKFRRPADLCADDYQKTIHTDLLWVYEGLTEHYGNLLAARTGAWSPENYREYEASIVAKLATMPGRKWRSLQDDADTAQVLYGARTDWSVNRLGVTFYDEGDQLWAEVDGLIRAKTNDQKSLDDFCRAFHGSTAAKASTTGEMPAVKPYTFAEVCQTLNTVCPNDWQAFFTTRLNAATGTPPTAGLESEGWTLAYTEESNDFVRGSGKYPSLMTNVGVNIGDDGKVSDIATDSAAFKAGLAPGMSIVAVNSRKLTPELLEDAVRASKDSKAIEFLVENGTFYSTIKVEYAGGLKWPHLLRKDGVPDRLSQAIKPLAGTK